MRTDFCTTCGRPYSLEDTDDVLGPAASPEEMQARQKRAEAALKYVMTPVAQRGLAVHDAPLSPRAETLLEREERLATQGALAPLVAAVRQYASDSGWSPPEVRHKQNLLVIALINRISSMAGLLQAFQSTGDGGFVAKALALAEEPT